MFWQELFYNYTMYVRGLHSCRRRIKPLQGLHYGQISPMEAQSRLETWSMKSHKASASVRYASVDVLKSIKREHKNSRTLAFAVAFRVCTGTQTCITHDHSSCYAPYYLELPYLTVSRYVLSNANRYPCCLYMYVIVVYLLHCCLWKSIVSPRVPSRLCFRAFLYTHRSYSLAFTKDLWPVAKARLGPITCLS